MPHLTRSSIDLSRLASLVGNLLLTSLPAIRHVTVPVEIRSDLIQSGFVGLSYVNSCALERTF